MSNANSKKQMINALFLDPRIWKIDYLTSPFWKPEKYGVKVDLHPNAFNIPKLGVDPKYKVVIATEVWEKPMQKTLEYLRSKGLKVAFIPRELAPAKSHLKLMFDDPQFEYNGKCYFSPDLFLAPGKNYYDLWEGKTDRKIVGCSRFDICLRPDLSRTKEQIIKRHGIEKGKRIIFFPSYPPYHTQTINNKNVMVDLADDLQNTLKALEKYALSHPEVQVVSKIHPAAQKCYNKKMGRGNEVAGVLKKYYENPTKHMKSIGDIRNDSSVAREMIISADIVVAHTSMMMLEAIIMGKPVLHVSFEQWRKLTQVIDYSSEVFTVYKHEDMESALNTGLSSDDLIVKDSKLVRHYLYKIDGKFCERVCDEIRKIVK